MFIQHFMTTSPVVRCESLTVKSITTVIIMKFFMVFAAVAAVACATPTMWTLSELNYAIQNPTTSATFKPVLQNALSAFMSHGQGQVPMAITTQSGSIGTYNLVELSHAIESKQIDSIFQPYFEKAINEMMATLFSGQNMNEISVEVPAFTISAWTLQELDDAVTSSDTDPKLLPYLTDALDKFVAAIFFGQTIDSIVVVAPAELFAAPATASPVPVLAPVSPAAPSVPEVPASSPLVQIILNVQSNPAVGAVLPSPSPVIVSPETEPVEDPLPALIIDRPRPEVSVNPIDVIAPLPVEAPVLNPMDIIAVLPIEDLHP